jgi:hypothetical protein
VVQVERASGLPGSGSVLIGNVPHHYMALSPNGLSGIYTLQAGAVVMGLAIDILPRTQVLDISQTYSSLDLLRQSYFMALAQGADLATIGRDLGVSRDPSIARDDVYRAVIKNVAFGPRGTTLGIKNALDAMVGPGNYILTEDVLTTPCQIQVSVPPALLLGDSRGGKSYFEGTGAAVAQGNVLTLSAGTLDATAARATATAVLADCTQALPGASTGFTIGGTAPTYDASRRAVGFYSAGQSTLVYADRSDPVDNAQAYAAIIVPQATPIQADPRAFCLALTDTTYAVYAGLVPVAGTGSFGICLCNASGTILASSTQAFACDVLQVLRLKKLQDRAVQLFVGDDLVAQADISSAFAAPNNAAPSVTIGQAIASANATNVRLLTMQIGLSPLRDVLSLGSTFGQTVAASPTTLTTSGSPGFVTADIGKRLVITPDAVTNPQGGNNGGVYTVAALSGTNGATLAGPTYANLSADGAHPGAITDGLGRFVYPQDLGKAIQFGAGGPSGTYVITDLQDRGFVSLKQGFFAPPQTAYVAICRPVDSTGTIGPAQSFAAQAGFSGTLTPRFVYNVNVSWALAGATVALAGALQVRNTLVEGTSYDLSAHHYPSATVLPTSLPTVLLLDGLKVPPVFNVYPLYVAEPLSFVARTLHNLTAAGVDVAFSQR